MEKQIRKIKLIYSGELLLIAVVFLVIGLLELLKVITIKDWVQLVFKIVTLAGAAWLIIDFLWTLLSPKKRAKNSLMDKVMMLPLAAYLLAFDIYGFVSPRPYEYYQIGIPIALFYIACAYIFQAIFHYKHPVPMVVEMINEASQEVQDDKEREVAADKLLEEGESVTDGDNDDLDDNDNVDGATGE